MQLIQPRYEFFVEANPWPQAKMPERREFGDDHEVFIVPIIMGSIFYVLGVLLFCLFLTAIPDTSVAPTGKPWVPAWARRDACLTPLFFVLPALFWPLVFPAMIIGFIYFVLKLLVLGLWSLVGPATSCCGIPLPRQWLRKPVEAVPSPAPDLELGPVDACSEVGVGGEPGGGLDDVDPTDVRCTGSGESERPPSYTSVPPDEDYKYSGEADGLLAKNTE